MKVLVDKNTKVVVDIRNIANITEEGINVGDLIYSSCLPIDVVDVETIPTGVVPQKYIYDGTSFTLNPNYVEYKTQDQINEDIQNKQSQIILALVTNGLM